jgi:hypothetical protein
MDQLRRPRAGMLENQPPTNLHKSEVVHPSRRRLRLQMYTGMKRPPEGFQGVTP